MSYPDYCIYDEVDREAYADYLDHRDLLMADERPSPDEYEDRPGEWRAAPSDIPVDPEDFLVGIDMSGDPDLPF